MREATTFSKQQLPLALPKINNHLRNLLLKSKSLKHCHILFSFLLEVKILPFLNKDRHKQKFFFQNYTNHNLSLKNANNIFLDKGMTYEVVQLLFKVSKTGGSCSSRNKNKHAFSFYYVTSLIVCFN